SGGSDSSENEYRCADGHERVEAGQVIVAHAYAAMTHRLSHRRLVIDVGAMDQVPVTRVELVGPEGLRHQPLRGADRWDEDLAVEDDLEAGRERPEVAERVQPADLVADGQDEAAVLELVLHLPVEP